MENGQRRRSTKASPDSVRAWGERRHALRTYRSLQVILAPVFRLLFGTSQKDIRRIPKKGPVILVSNHSSNLDPVVVIATLHRTVFHLGKHTLFNTPFKSWFFQTLGGQIPVNRERGGNEAAIHAAVKALARGVALAIYPEGHRSPDGKLRRGKPGLGRIAYLSGAPCFPVAIEGTLDLWPKQKKLPRLFVGRSRVLVGPARRYPVDPKMAEDYQACQGVTDELMSDIARLLGQPYDPATAPPAVPEKAAGPNA